MEAALVPKWSEHLVCASNNTRCRAGECEQLHVAQGWESRKCKAPQRGKLVVCAGPERSGSTWLFNAVRLLLEDTGERVHSYWLHDVTTEKLKQRGMGNTGDKATNLVVKTHEWSDEWNTSSADLILLTERDVCGVVNSYIRVGWLPYDMQYLKSFVGNYLANHEKWKAAANLVVPFEHLADSGGLELECINRLQQLLELPNGNSQAISRTIRELRVPSHGGPDGLSKLWPRHIGGSYESSLNIEDCRALRNTSG